MSLRTDIKEAWIDDLDNGNHKQGQGKLKNEYEEFCCLGRLCEVLREKFGFDISLTEDENGEFLYVYKGTTSYEVLPSALATELGIDENPEVAISPEDEEDEYTYDLAHLNDNGHTFHDIAEYIRNNDL